MASGADHTFEEVHLMIKRTLGWVALCGWLIAASGYLQAHHSLAGVYDMTRETEQSGTVASVKFTHPHG